jgi:hypothetical protein
LLQSLSEQLGRQFAVTALEPNRARLIIHLYPETERQDIGGLFTEDAKEKR